MSLTIGDKIAVDTSFAANTTIGTTVLGNGPHVCTILLMTLQGSAIVQMVDYPTHYLSVRVSTNPDALSKGYGIFIGKPENESRGELKNYLLDYDMV